MAQNVARLGVVLGIDTAEFTKGIEAAKKSILGFANQIPVYTAAGVAAFTAMSAKAMEFADHMSDLADANEMSISSILKMSEALEMSGGRAKDAGKLLASFTSKIDEAAQGSNSAQNAFSRIGISLRDLGKMSNEQLFQKTLDQLAKVPDVVTRNALAFQVFGKAVRGVDMKAMAEEMAKAKDEFDKYEDAIRTSADLHDKLAKKTTMLMLTFNQQVIPTLSAMFDAMGQKGGIAEVVFEKLRQGMLGLWYVAGSIKNTFTLIGLEWDKLAGNISNDEFKKKVQELQDDQLAFKKKLNDLDKPAEVVKKPKVDVERQVTDAQEQAYKTAKLLSIEFEKQQILKFEQLKRQRELVEMTTNERAVAESVYRIEDDRYNKVADIQKKIAEEKAKKPSDQQPKVIAELEKQIELVNQTAEAYKKLTEEEVKSQQEAQRTFTFGWNQAFKQYAEDATNSAKMAADVFKTVTQTMENAIVQFITTGKLSFKSFAQTVITELVRIQAKAIAAQASSNILGAIPWGSLFGNVSTALQYGTNIGSQQTAMLAAQGFADGGNPPVGVPSIVGENGPELFIPSRSGTIIPNNQLGEALGGTTNVTNNYINAIDVKSFEDRLLNSSNAVWAANQYANKSLAVGRGRT